MSKNTNKKKNNNIIHNIFFNDFFNFPVFIVSLALGILFVYLANPNDKVIYIYPTPDNVNNLEFKDKANNCFKYSANNVECPKDSSKITDVPIQSS